MKVLMVNKFHYIKGGSETYYFALKRLLEAKGHIVIDFSMQDEKNFPSKYSEYFVSNIDYSASNGLTTKMKLAGNIIYSFEAKRKFERLVQEEKPDLIHLHIFQHQLSPSILDVIKKYNIPTVYTAHDLKMVCLNYKMMHHGIICEDCIHGGYLWCMKNRCVKDSLLKSSINVAEGYFHMWRKSYDVIDVIITPSKFYKRKFEEFGVESERIIHIPNFLDNITSEVRKAMNGKKYFLYLGRLSEEKGVKTLIKAVEGTELPLYVVGTGPLKEELEAFIKDKGLSNVLMLGFKNGQDLVDLVGNARAIVLPSEWYENGPYSAIEALQLGRPLIGADIGGIPELINKNGYTFEAGNFLDLRDKLLKINDLSEDAYHEMEKESYALYNDIYTDEVHWAQLKRVYDQILLKEK